MARPPKRLSSASGAAFVFSESESRRGVSEDDNSERSMSCGLCAKKESPNRVERSTTEGINGGRRSKSNECFCSCNLNGTSQLRVGNKHFARTHLLICSSNFSILAAFWRFLGFGFLTTTVGGATSSRPNQSDISDRFPKSFSSSSCMTRAICDVAALMRRK